MDELAPACESRIQTEIGMKREGYFVQKSVRFGVRCNQQHRQWGDIREWFQAADGWGFETAWLFDHMIPIHDSRTGPNLDGWTLLAGLAEATNNIEIGPMVTGITYRNPALLLKIVTSVDHISNGRALLGLGAAWFEDEHEMFGIDFPRVGDRVRLLQESLEAFAMLQEQDTTTYDGKLVKLKEAIFEPKPVRNPMPVVIGASGDRMLRIVGRFADQWDNNNISDNDAYRERTAKVEAAAAAAGRDPSDIRRSTSIRPHLFDDHDALVARIRELREIGITDFLLHTPDKITPSARDFAEKVVPELRKEFA